jgi:hypothetical protein
MFCGLNGQCAQGSAVRLRGNLGQTEIENLRLTSLRNEDVRWFDVTVNDPLRVLGKFSCLINRSNVLLIQKTNKYNRELCLGGPTK